MHRFESQWPTTIPELFHTTFRIFFRTTFPDYFKQLSEYSEISLRVLFCAAPSFGEFVGDLPPAFVSTDCCLRVRFGVIVKPVSLYMAGEGEIFMIEVEGKLQLLMLLIEAYKANIITQQELINFLVDILYQN